MQLVQPPMHPVWRQEGASTASSSASKKESLCLDDAGSRRPAYSACMSDYDFINNYSKTYTALLTMSITVSLNLLQVELLIAAHTKEMCWYKDAQEVPEMSQEDRSSSRCQRQTSKDEPEEQ